MGVSRRRRRSFTRDFKLSALKRMAEADNIQALAEELGIERRLLYWWRDAFALGGEPGLRRAGRPSMADRVEAAMMVAEAKPAPAVPSAKASAPVPGVAELQRKIGEQQAALDFFEAALRHFRERRQQSGVPGGTVSTP
jgi:transposase-like protein